MPLVYVQALARDKKKNFFSVTGVLKLEGMIPCVIQLLVTQSHMPDVLSTQTYPPAENFHLIYQHKDIMCE